mgnify:CR=1 FL=1
MLLGVDTIAVRLAIRRWQQALLGQPAAQGWNGAAAGPRTPAKVFPAKGRCMNLDPAIIGAVIRAA